MLDDADRRATAVMEEQDAYSVEHRGGILSRWPGVSRSTSTSLTNSGRRISTL